MSGINLTLVDSKRIVQKNWAKTKKDTEALVYKMLQNINLSGDYYLIPGRTLRGSSAKKGIQIKPSTKRVRSQVTLVIQPSGNDTCRAWVLRYPAWIKSDMFLRSIQEALVSADKATKKPVKNGRTLTLNNSLPKPVESTQVESEAAQGGVSDIIVQASLLKQRASEYAKALKTRADLEKRVSADRASRLQYEERVATLTKQLQQAEGTLLEQMELEESSRKELNQIGVILSDNEYRAAHEELAKLKKIIA